MRRPFALACLLVIVLATVGGSLRADPPPPFQVIVNPTNPVVTAKRQFLADAFLKKTTTWPGGLGIRPVDLGPKSVVRAHFSEDVLHRSVAEVKSYWQQRIFSGGDVPPPELDKDEDVVKYVLKHPGAIGYVSGGAKLEGAKVLIVK
jgi:ABC-type phosphate transport system substrate-binding protein